LLIVFLQLLHEQALALGSLISQSLFLKFHNLGLLFLLFGNGHLVLFYLPLDLILVLLVLFPLFLQLLKGFILHLDFPHSVLLFELLDLFKDVLILLFLLVTHLFLLLLTLSSLVFGGLVISFHLF